MRSVERVAGPVLVGLLVAVVPVAAEATYQADSAELKQKVAGLLNKLDAETRKVRTRAERELLQLGPRILPYLPPPELASNVSVREAVRRVRIGLERRKARDSVLASRVTLNGTLPLSGVLDSVWSQTGNRIDLGQVPARLGQSRIAVDYRRQSYWSVMDDLAARSGLQYSDESETHVLKLAPGSRNSKRGEIAVMHCGAFRVGVRSARLRPAFGDIRIGFGLRAEPRLRPLFLKYRGNDLAAFTPAGAALKPSSPQASYELPLGEGGQHLKLHADFKIPAGMPPTQIGLRGQVTMQTAAGIERITFRDLQSAEGSARRRGGVTVTLTQVTFRRTSPEEHQLALKVAVNYDTGGPAFESHRTWIFHNQVYLVTTKDRRIEVNDGYETALQSDGGVAVVYRFRRLTELPSEYQFVYVAPTLIINVPIEFEFAKIPVSSTVADTRPNEGDFFLDAVSAQRPE